MIMEFFFPSSPLSWFLPTIVSTAYYIFRQDSNKMLLEDTIQKSAIRGFEFATYTRFACGHQYVQRSTGRVIMVTNALNMRQQTIVRSNPALRCSSLCVLLPSISCREMSSTTIARPRFIIVHRRVLASPRILCFIGAHTKNNALEKGAGYQIIPTRNVRDCRSLLKAIL